MTITWRIGDLKISQVDADEVTKLIYWMKGIYSSHMKESHKNNHDYLGMDLGFSLEGEVRVKMTDCLNKIVSDFPETIQVIVTTPAAEHQFTVS